MKIVLELDDAFGDRLIKALSSDASIAREVRKLNRKLDRVIGKEDILMSQVDDLKTAVAGLKTAVTDEIARVTEDLAAKKGDDPDVAAAIADLNALSASVSGFDPHNPPAPAAGT